MGLDGIRVLDLTWLLPGPYATMILGDLGADVIKVEQPGRGDYTRDMIPDIFQMANRNKRSLALDLKLPAGREAFYRMVGHAHVVVEAFRPGVAARLGVDYASLKAINPGLVYCSITGYGQESPLRDLPGHDVSYLGMGGGLSIPGDLGYPPVRPSLPVADLSSACFAAIAILSALREAQATGQGDYVDLAMVDCISAWAATRLGNVLWKQEPPHLVLSALNRCYTAGDGRRLTISVVEDHFFAAFCRATGMEVWLTDPRFSTVDLRFEHALALLPLVEELMQQHSRDEWVEILARAGVPSGPVLEPDEVYTSPHAGARGLVQELVDESGQTIRQYRFPARFGHQDTRVRRLPPRLGEHSREILAELGFSPVEITALCPEATGL